MSLVARPRLDYLARMLPRAAEIRDEYQRLRQVQRALNSKLVKTLTKKAIEQSARDLDLWEDGKIVLQHEDHMGVLADYAIYEYRVAGKSAVERCAARSHGAEGTDEGLVIEAMLNARFTLVSIQKIVPQVGAQVVDHIYGDRFLLADVGLSQTGARGDLLATRLLPLPRFTMTSGAPLAFDPELATWILEGVGAGSGDLATLRLIARKQRKHMARTIIALAMEDPALVKVAWRENVAGRGAG